MGMRVPRWGLALLASGVLLAGCGGGQDEDKGDDDSSSASPSPSAGDDNSSGEPGTLSGTFTGAFRKVDNPPEGTDDVKGTVEMEVGDDGTKVSVEVEGLEDKAVYVAHVHKDACAAADPGGAHYKYDPDGGDQPPNEIHLDVKNEDGKGTGEAENDDAATSEARSVVLHLKRAANAKKDETKPPKVACADLVKEQG